MPGLWFPLMLTFLVHGFLRFILSLIIYPGRKLDNGEKDMLRHIHFESGMSLTGANADIRKKIKPSEEKILLVDLYNKIAEKTGG